MPLTPEELARIEAGVETLETEEREELDGLSLLGEEIALLAIENEERDEQILEEIERICNRLDELSTPPATAENPSFQALLTEVATLRTETAELKGLIEALTLSMATRTREPQPRESEPEPSPIPEPINPAEHEPEESTEGHEPGDHSPRNPPKRHHMI